MFPCRSASFSVVSVGPKSPYRYVYCACTVVLTHAEIRRFDGMPSMCQPWVARLLNPLNEVPDVERLH